MGDTRGAVGSTHKTSGRLEKVVGTTRLPSELEWTQSVSEVFQIRWQINMTDLDLISTCITEQFPDSVTDRFYVKVSKNPSEIFYTLVVEVFKCGQVDQKLRGGLLLMFKPSVMLYDEEDKQVTVPFGANSNAEVVMSKECRQQRFLKDGVLRMGCSVSVPRPQEAAKLGSLSLALSNKQLIEGLWIGSLENGDCEVYNIQYKHLYINAHKAVLSARSPVFKQLIDTNSKVTLPLDYDGSLALLQFVYLGHCDSKYYTEEMLTAAQEFKLNHLMVKVELHFANSLNKDNVLRYLELAYKVDTQRLRDACLKYLEVSLAARGICS